MTPATLRDRGGDVAGDGVLERAAGDGEQHRDARPAPSSSISTDSTMPRSVIGRLISGSLTVARAAVDLLDGWGVLMMPQPTWCAGPVVARRSVPGSWPSGVLVGRGPLVELAEQRAQLRAQEVAGGDLADRHPQRGHLAGQELHVGVGPGVGLPVLLGDHPVARLLPVLREQDQRGGVRRLEAEHQGQEDERVVVPAQRPSGASAFQTTQTTTNSVM